MSPHKIVLDEASLPTHWYNVDRGSARAARAAAAPRDAQPVGPGGSAPLFPMAIILQEVSGERWIAIPEEVREAYRHLAPDAAVSAPRRLEQALGTPARIYYKYEGVSPAGSHKPNTAVPQAYYNALAGREAHRDRDRRRAVGHRRSRSRAQLFGLECNVYMVRVSYQQKPYRRSMMQTLGRGGASPSPSPRTNAGRARPRGGSRLARLARDRDLRGGRGRRHATRTPRTRSAAC